MGKGGQPCCHGDQEEDAPGDKDEALGRTALSVVEDSEVVVTAGGMVEATPGGGLLSSRAQWSAVDRQLG